MLNVPEIESGKTNRVVEISFLVWLLTLPFGAKIGSFSLGFFSVYPNFVATLVLFVIVIPSILKWKRILQVFFALLGLWLAFALVYPFFRDIGMNDDWKFDVRSLGMQCMFAGIIFGTFYTLKISRFKGLLKSGIFYYLGILIVVGLFEFYSGIHLRGTWTDKFLTLDTVSWIYYSPLFVYDNPNDFLVYFLGLALLCINFLPVNSTNRWLSTTFFFLAFIFAEVASSRIAIFASVAIVIVQLIIITRQYLSKKFIINSAIYFLVGTLFIALLVFRNDNFIGPKYSNGAYLQNGEYAEFPTSEQDEGYSSDFVRKNLMLNSFDFIKEKPLLGIGPGQFRFRHKERTVTYETGTVIGPHNYVLEVVSQYGIIAWLYLAFLGYLFYKQVRKCMRRREGLWVILLWLVFAMMMLMPSGFLYLDINWLIVPILALFSADLLSFLELSNE